jgi:restriction endonuclease Mrr
MSVQPLQRVLQRSSLHSLLLVTSKMLSRSGFGDVQILDRREPRQRSRFGGHELLCETNVGSLPVRIVVKVINDAVRLRMLDELAGVVIRTKSDLGLIVTPHHLTASARRHQEAFHSARIEVIDGVRLAEKLTSLGIGVREKGSIDFAFFMALEEAADRITAFMRKGDL